MSEMVKIHRYERTQTDPHMGGLYTFTCADCEKSATIFCLEACQDHNKYLVSGLCPRCFEVAVEVKMRAGAVLVNPLTCPACGVAFEGSELLEVKEHMLITCRSQTCGHIDEIGKFRRGEGAGDGDAKVDPC